MLQQNWMKEIITDIYNSNFFHHFTAITTVADLYMEVHLDATKKIPKTNKKTPKLSRSQLMMLCK